LDQLAMNFNLMLDRLQRLLAQVQQVTTDVAHDLRTPLTRVRQKMEALDALPGLPADASALVQVIDDDLQEILHSFDALLQLAEIERLDQVGNGPVIDLSEPVRRVIEAYLPDIEGQGRKLRYRLESAFLKGDAALLSQLLANLIENVLAHSPRGSDLTIEVLGAASGPVLRVADRGPGVPPQFRHSVLQPYKRLEASRSTFGAGLGLSIAAAIATCHGAELALEDNHPGLVVEVRFRAASQPAPLCHESVGFPD
jgi:signal transduction histidine kinase